MGYSTEQIMGFADEHVEKLDYDELMVESLLNSSILYAGELEEEYSTAVRNSNPNSRLFKATYEN